MNLGDSLCFYNLFDIVNHSCNGLGRALALAQARPDKPLNIKSKVSLNISSHLTDYGEELKVQT